MGILEGYRGDTRGIPGAYQGDTKGIPRVSQWFTTGCCGITSVLSPIPVPRENRDKLKGY